MKKIIAAVVFITFQCIALWILYIGNFKNSGRRSRYGNLRV